MIIRKASNNAFRFQPSLTEWLCLLAGAFFTFWYAWILDDAFVYFRYVDNLVINGIGLVYNAGEFVEGFSSPFWAMFLIVARAAQFNFWYLVIGVGMLSYVAFWYLACIINRGLQAGDPENGLNLNVPLIYLTLTYGVLSYFTSGLESPFVLIMAGVYAATILHPRNTALLILVGLSPLVRHELFAAYAILLAWIIWRARAIPYAAIVTCGTTLGAYLLFRIWYYADLFPVTFHLKNESWVSQGIEYVFDTTGPYHTLPYLLLAVVGWLLLRASNKLRRETSMQRAAMVLAALPVLLYVIKIGGDPRHFRYLTFPYCLIIFATGGIAEDLIHRYANMSRPLVYVAILAFGAITVASYPDQITVHPFFILESEKTARTMRHINDSAVWRGPRQVLGGEHYFSPPDLSVSAARERYKPRRAKERLHAQGLCHPMYMRPDAVFVHSAGLTDGYLARTQMSSRRPAHKPGLKALARDIVRIYKKRGRTKGAFDRALRTAPDWIKDNIDSIREIDRKVHNQHDFIENLQLALFSFPRIDKNVPDPLVVLRGEVP